MTEENNIPFLPEVPLPETERSPEMVIRELTARIDRGLHELGVPPRDKRAWGWCNFVPDAVSYCALQDSQEKGYQVRVAKYQARDLHLVAAGQKTLEQVLPPDWNWFEHHAPEAQAEVDALISSYYKDPTVSRVVEETAGHGFNVVEVNGAAFLVDLSFSQFIGEDGTLTHGGVNISSGVSSDHPLAQQLLHNGYTPLDDENLRAYMRFLCTDQPDYLAHVTTDLFNHVNALPFAPDDNELMGRIPPTYQAPPTPTT